MLEAHYSGEGEEHNSTGSQSENEGTGKTAVDGKKTKTPQPTGNSGLQMF